MRFLILLCLLAMPALAEEATSTVPEPAATPTSPAQPLAGLGGGQNNGPITISAEKSLEWHEKERMYVATGKAKAIRGTVTLEADTLRAFDRKKADAGKTTQAANPDSSKNAAMPGGADGNSEIWKMEAQGHVHITNNGPNNSSEVFGEQAVYDIDSHKAVLTGEGLRYKSLKDAVTAKQSLEYDETANTATARGNAVGVRDGRTVKADVLTTFFGKDSKGQQTTDRLEATGKVEVLSATERALCDHLVFHVAENRADLFGHVQITKDGNQLNGDKAETNFTTGISRLLNQGGGRVQARIMANQPDKKTQSPAKPAEPAKP